MPSPLLLKTFLQERVSHPGYEQDKTAKRFVVSPVAESILDANLLAMPAGFARSVPNSRNRR
jgi:hypothetical protein